MFTGVGGPAAFRPGEVPALPYAQTISSRNEIVPKGNPSCLS